MNDKPYIVVKQNEKTGYYTAEIWWPDNKEFAYVNDFYKANAVDRALLIIQKCWPFILDGTEIRVVED